MLTKNITNRPENIKKNRRNLIDRTPTMSNKVNDTLLEQAAFYIDYFTGTILAEVLEKDVAGNDLDSLAAHLVDARKTAFELEYNPDHQGDNSMVDDHITILTVSEGMDKWLPMMQNKINALSMSHLDRIEVAILMGLVEGTVIYLREKANIIAETQP